MGKSGSAAKRLLLASGVQQSDIFTFDSKEQGVDFNDSHEMIRAVSPQTIVVSPGVPLSLDWIQSLKNEGTFVTSEISLAASCITSEKIIGITGSLGKSTTVSILGAGAKAIDPNAFVGGNLGFPFADYACDVILNKRALAKWIVLELSSYQLENCSELNLESAAITYLTPNHMERYQGLEDYYQTKWDIYKLSKNPLILNKHGGDLENFSKDKNQSYVFSDINSPEIKSFNLKEAALIGSHNQDNIALACKIALQLGWNHSAVQAMKDFTGLEHRLENMGDISGVRYINDSKATAMDSVLTAVLATHESRKQNSRIFVLLGGKDKGLPWETLGGLKKYPDMEFVFFGDARIVGQKKSLLPGRAFSKLYEAIEYCTQNTKNGDTVLLSPGGTSLDEFKNFEERGNFFKRTVLSLSKS